LSTSHGYGPVLTNPAKQTQGNVYNIPFEIQSGSTADNNIVKLSNKATYENVNFSDQHDPYLYTVDSVMDPTRKLQDADDATLEHFFSRPIKIHEEEWSTSSVLGFSIDPWNLYFTNPRVINRIANYALLRTNLMIKVVINGNGFQYGRAMMSYLPYDAFDALSASAGLIQNDLIQASQRPRIFLDPTLSTGGEMKLPFFNYSNSLRIDTSQWGEMGVLYFNSLNELKHANGASDKVTISVFAWATDVEMNVLTSVDPSTLSPQSGKEIDEANTKGVISGPATKVAKVAGMMRNVPYIGPFASATEIGATATSKIAKIFGYCRPPVTKNPEPYKPTAVSSLALTNVPDGTQKLTIDDKQELSIDPRIAGLNGVDPLNIVEIAKRESYLTTFSWNIGTAPETLLWNSRISPVTWAQTTVGETTAYHFPACAMAALPFRWWTGTMKFRFQIVASSFHKGRLKFVYDPNYLASNEYNTNYLKIVDIAEEQDFTLEIGNGQNTTYLGRARPGLDSPTEVFSTTNYTSKGPGNGIIGVYVVNELTTPNSTVNNDIEINVFVSMGDDFEVAVPDKHFQNFVFAPQSGFEIQSGIVPDGQNTVEPSAPQQEYADSLGPGGQDGSKINHVYMGESVQSFRTMLKRYVLHSSIAQVLNIPRIKAGRRPHLPMYRGAVPGAVSTTSSGTPYNYCNTLLLHWVVGAFSGWRGSIRYKLIPRTAFDVVMHVERARYAFQDTAYLDNDLSIAALNDETASRSVMTTEFDEPSTDSPLPGYNGKAYTNSRVNPILEFEVPYYSNYRFTPGKTANKTTRQEFEGGFDYRLYMTGDNTSIVDVYAASGEDFQTYFFTGLPRMYYEPIPAAV